MDIEQKQAELIDYFVKQAASLKGSPLVDVIVEATSHPSLFAFSEILSLPTIVEVYLANTCIFLLESLMIDGLDVMFELECFLCNAFDISYDRSNCWMLGLWFVTFRQLSLSVLSFGIRSARLFLYSTTLG